MWEIREELSTDFLLNRKGFMKIIDRRNKGHELIFPTISYRSISFPIDNILDVSDDSTDRAKYRADPKKISKKYKDQPDNIHKYYSLKYIRHKSSFDRIFSKCSKIKCWKYIFFCRIQRKGNHSISRVILVRHIKLWIIRDIFYRSREIREFGKYSKILRLITLIEFSDLQKGSDTLRIRSILIISLGKLRDIDVKISFREDLKRSDIYDRSKNKDDPCNKGNTIREVQWNILWIGEV